MKETNLNMKSLEELAKDTLHEVQVQSSPTVRLKIILTALKEAARRYGECKKHHTFWNYEDDPGCYQCEKELTDLRAQLEQTEDAHDMADSALEECRAQLKSITPLKNSDIRLVRDLTLEAQQLRAQLESAQAAGVEKDGALNRIVNLMKSMQVMGYFTNDEWQSRIDQGNKALSNTCGKELLSELERLRAEVEILDGQVNRKYGINDLIKLHDQCIAERDQLKAEISTMRDGFTKLVEELEQARKDGESLHDLCRRMLKALDNWGDIHVGYFKQQIDAARQVEQKPPQQ